MPTLAELKSKWFIPMSGDVLGVPCRRHDGAQSQLSASTDGNVVTPLIDGEAYMARWRGELLKLHHKPGAEFMHTGWRLDDVKTLGKTKAGGEALAAMNDADGASVACFVLACRNLACLFSNVPSLIKLDLNAAPALDERFPIAGSNHQKFSVFKSADAAVAMLGSVDITKDRWDRIKHETGDLDRPKTPTHDAGVAIKGPAVRDVELTYRERWNDSTRTIGLTPGIVPRPLITSAPAASSPVGAPAEHTHSVQILRTYGITRELFGYSWSPSGEFTVWASYLNAITKAEQYIYIEDQYCLPWGWPPRFALSGNSRSVDIIFQLGEAMKRGVQVAILVPGKDEDPTAIWQKYQRDIGVNYLTGVKAAGASGDIVVASLTNGTTSIYVHSKLMIVDDELVLIGSANVGQRSMTHDGELHAGVVDSDGKFARELRQALWAEHTGRGAETLGDPLAAYALFAEDTAASVHHRLRPYPVNPNVVFPPAADTPEPWYAHVMIMSFIEPFAGPPGLA